MWHRRDIRFAVALAVVLVGTFRFADGAVACRFQTSWAAAASQRGMLRTVQAFDAQGAVLRADGTSADDRTCDPALDERLASAINETLRAGGVVLLGEVHDNAHHHSLRGLLIDFVAAKPRPAMVFEHIRADQHVALEQFAKLEGQIGRPATAGDLFRLLEWDKSGWPDQKIYEPLLSAGVAAQLPILPGDPPKGKVREVSRAGFDAIAPDARARMKLDTPLPSPMANALTVELKDNHCGMLPDSALPGLSRAQQYRDAHLADALLKAADTYGSAILLTGNGHARNDRGVPWHVRQRAPGKGVLSVLLLEVENGNSDLDSHVPRAPDGQPAADYILFTPRAERPDPCAEMRRSFGTR